MCHVAMPRGTQNHPQVQSRITPDTLFSFLLVYFLGGLKRHPGVHRHVIRSKVDPPSGVTSRRVCEAVYGITPY